MSNRWMKRADEMAQYGFGPKAMMAVKVCSHCGKQAPANEDFCRNCGEPLHRQTLLKIYQCMHPFCPACGTVAPDDALFCPVCGTRLDNIDDTDKKLIADGTKMKMSISG